MVLPSLLTLLMKAGYSRSRTSKTRMILMLRAVSGETMTKNHLIKKDACYRCPIACGRYSKWEGGEGAGPEYEAVWSFGPDCGIHDYDAIHRANDLCNKLGMDSISAGTTIATAMELFQRGYIKPEELDGISLEWGNVEGMVEWTRKMAYGEGFGAKLAQGSYRLAESYGHPEPVHDG